MLTETREERIARLTKSCMTKVRYPTETRARLAIQKCEEDRGIALRVYKCDNCDGFHLTSKWRTPKGFHQVRTSAK